MRGPKPVARATAARIKVGNILGNIQYVWAPEMRTKTYRCWIFRNGEIVSEEYAADIKAAALFVDMSIEELCPGRRILSVEYALSAGDENDDGSEE